MWRVLEVVHVLKVVVVEQGCGRVDGARMGVVVLTAFLLYQVSQGLRRLIPWVKPCQSRFVVCLTFGSFS